MGRMRKDSDASGFFRTIGHYDKRMVTVTISEAKAKLAELVKRAQAGEEVIITSGRGKTPVAWLRGIPEAKPLRLMETRETLPGA
jgi:prevent-host-death family protein